MERQHDGIIQAILETPTLRERFARGAADIAGFIGAGPDIQQFVFDYGGDVADFVPILSDAAAFEDVGRDLAEAEYGSAAIGTGLAAIGLFPMIGDLAAKFGRKLWGRGSALRGEGSHAAERLSPDLPRDPEISLPGTTPEPASQQLDLAARPEVPHRDLQRYVPPNGPSHRILAATSNPKVRERLLEAIDEGLALGARGWLDTDEIFQRFVRELGPERGFKDYMEFLDKIAATSPLSDPGTNIRSASYYFTQHGREGLLDPAVKNPNPHGHIAEETHKKILAGSLEGGGFDSVKAPKISAMAENMKGNPQPVMIDTRLMRLLGRVSEDPRFLNSSVSKRVHEGKMSMKEAFSKPANFDSRPRQDEYGHFERYVQDLARERGLTPLDVHLAWWLREAAKQRPHHRPEDFRSFMDHFKHRIRLTAQKRGIAEEEVWRQLIRRENPLLVLPAAAVGAGVLADDSPTEPPNEWMSGGGPAP